MQSLLYNNFILDTDHCRDLGLYSVQSTMGRELRGGQRPSRAHTSRFQQQLDRPCPTERGCLGGFERCGGRGDASGTGRGDAGGRGDAEPTRRLCLCSGPSHSRALAQVEAGIACMVKRGTRANFGGGQLSIGLEAIAVARLLPLGVSGRPMPPSARRGGARAELGHCEPRGAFDRAASLHRVGLHKLTRLGRWSRLAAWWNLCWV